MKKLIAIILLATVLAGATACTSEPEHKNDTGGGYQVSTMTGTDMSGEWVEPSYDEEENERIKQQAEEAWESSLGEEPEEPEYDLGFYE